MVTVAEALAQATRQHQAGQLADAEKIYRQILAVDPNNAQALYQFGRLAMQVGQFEAAVQLLSGAIQVDSSQALFHANLAEAYRSLGKTTEAIRSLREAVAVNPGDDQILAVLGRFLYDQRDFAEAEVCFRTAVSLTPGQARAHFNLGTILQSQGKLAEARDSYLTAVKMRPSDADIHNNLASVLKELGEFAESELHARRAIAIKPDFAAAHNNLGAVLSDQARYEEAAVSCQRATQINPDFAEAYCNLAGILRQLDRLDEGLAAAQKTIELSPDFAAAHNSLGAVLSDQARYEEAAASCQRATQINPGFAEAYSNLAGALRQLDRLDEGLGAAQKTIELSPELASAYCNQGQCLELLGRVDEAIDAYRAAISLDPASAILGSNLLNTLNFSGAFGPAEVFAEHLKWAQRHADPLSRGRPAHVNTREPNRRLRVGYVSAHFRVHAVNFFTEPILASHDHDAVEVVCYSDVVRKDEATDRLQTYADRWRDIAGQTDEQVSELMRRDEIDIAVDLAGHIDGTRLLVFARRPAPVQVTYIGYQNTTGMANMDYRLTDTWADPPGVTDGFYTERLVRLPDTFFCYLPPAAAPPLTPLPALTSGAITFGSFNNFKKVGPDTLDAWARILLAVPGARLILLAPSSALAQDYIHNRLQSQGVSSQRVEIHSRLPNREYLQLIARADIALDPFPFNGHTTTCDSIWMGVPVVMLAGNTYASRFGGSVLRHAGLTDLMASNREQYVDLAVSLAGNVNRLQSLRANLRTTMLESPILDARRFTRNLEAAYRQMWAQWCGGSASK